MEFTAPSIDTTNNTEITLGGSRVGEDGTWNPQAKGLTLIDRGKTANLVVKAGSAVWVKLDRTAP
jgi:hypothetical protein